MLIARSTFLPLLFVRPILASSSHHAGTNHQIRMSSSSSSSEKVFAQGGETDHGIKLEGKKAQVVQDCLDLFSAKFTKEILDRSWAKDAIFADPIAYATGREQYEAQWAGMKVFASSETLAWKVTKDEPPILEFENRQRYVFPGVKSEKIMSSLIHIELDADNKIKLLEDRWDGKPLPQGRIAKAMRDFSATYIVPNVVNVDKADKDTKSEL